MKGKVELNISYIHKNWVAAQKNNRISKYSPDSEVISLLMTLLDGRKIGSRTKVGGFDL